jgi:hypothetical protein
VVRLAAQGALPSLGQVYNQVLSIQLFLIPASTFIAAIA